MNSIDSSSLFENNEEEVLFNRQMHQNKKHSYNQQTISAVEEQMPDSLSSKKKAGVIVLKQLA